MRRDNMEFISLRSIYAIVLALASALSLTPLAPVKTAICASLIRAIKLPHEIMLTEATPKITQPRSKLIKQYLADIFGVPGFKASWYDNIINVEVEGDTVTVKTNLSRGDKKIMNICGVFSGFVYSHLNAQLGIKKVRILGRLGEVIVFRKSALNGCPP
jgi:hypothetical protein